MLDTRNSPLLKAGLILLCLWVLVWGGIRFFGSMTPTPEKIAAYVDENPLTEIDDPEKRREVIGTVADMLNQLPVEEIGRLAREGDEDGGERRFDPRRGFFQEMNEEEQRFFMEKRIGKAFDQMMQAFNGMEREERKRVVERTLKQMRDGDRRQGIDRLEESDPEMAEKIVNEGLRAYYQEADADTKLDLAPVLEQMQLNIGGGGGRPR